MNFPGASDMQAHHGIIIPCLGMMGRSPLPRQCQTLIGLILDQGPSSFRCPVCESLYIIDPLVKSDFATAGKDFSVSEMGGHRVEIFFGKGKIAQRTRSDYHFASTFLTPKIGSIDNAYIAEVYSAPGMGNEVFSEMASGQRGPESHSLSNVSQASGKRLQAVNWSRVVLYLILIVACIAVGVLILMTAGS